MNFISVQLINTFYGGLCQKMCHLTRTHKAYISSVQIYSPMQFVLLMFYLGSAGVQSNKM